MPWAEGEPTCLSYNYSTEYIVDNHCHLHKAYL